MLGSEVDDGTIVVVCADPTNVVAFDDVRLASKARRVRPVVKQQIAGDVTGTT